MNTNEKQISMTKDLLIETVELRKKEWFIKNSYRYRKDIV
jgi:hypothetical protein